MTDSTELLAPLRMLSSSPTIETVELALRAMVGSLDGADALARRSAREEAVRILRDLDVRGAAGLVDAALATAEHPDDAQGTAITLDDPEPWPSPVDGAELLDELSTFYGRYLVLPDGGEDVLAIWTAHTYAMDAWEHTGYLALVSATRRCGKTTALRMIEALAHRSMRADCITAAALYRIVESWCPTLLLDELDRMHSDSDLWPVLLSGHTRGATVPRCVGDDHEPRLWHTYGARAISYIRGSRCPVPDAIEDRCITIQMSRRRSSETRERLRSRALRAEALPVRRRLVRWTDDHTEELEAAAPEIPEVLDDRAADSWEPLLAVADAAGGRWPARARELAIAYSATRRDDERESASVLVLADLVELLDTRRLAPEDDRLAAEDMCRELRELRDRPWATWGRDRQGLSTHALGRLLRQHGLRAQRTRSERRWSAAQIRDAASRYGDISPNDASEQSVIASFGGSSEAQPTDTTGRDAMTLRKRHDATGSREDASTRRPYSPPAARAIHPRDIIRRYGGDVGLGRTEIVTALRRDGGLSREQAEAALEAALETEMVVELSGRYHAGPTDGQDGRLPL